MVLPQVLVKYKSGKNNQVRNALGRMGAIHQRELANIGVDVLNVPPGQSVQSFVAQLKKNDDIEFVEPNGVLRALYTPNDPSFSSQYFMTSSYSNITGAWDVAGTTGAASVVVAVIDTGITPTHSDLSNQLWSNPSPSGNSGAYGTQIGIDWNGDGDFVDTDPSLGPEQDYSATPIDNNTGEYHGTRVAGIIAAQINNGVNISGVAPGCKIMTVKALTSAGAGDYAAIAAGITYAVTNGASVINLSLGGESSSQTVLDAVNNAIANNVVVVAAAGNDGNGSPVNFPASIASVIAVGATDASNNLASFSCTGPSVDLVAPGVGIISTIAPNTISSPNDATGNDGTSFSAPIVAGVAALMRSLGSPTLSVEQITTYLTLTANDRGLGTNNSYGHGLLNASLAIQSAMAGTVLSAKAAGGETNLYPNPFNPLTTANAHFALPSGVDEAGVEIKIFNVVGEEVQTLRGAQYKSWDGKNEDGSLLAPGIYFYRAQTSVGDLKGKFTIKQ
ncbi:MAG: hypothetical protein KCHDKBKB_00919 [Elusimicrobia bacterium]|nr:hypothetical protein [Elusimicrobiota bacterium]